MSDTLTYADTARMRTDMLARIKISRAAIVCAWRGGGGGGGIIFN